MDEETKKTLCRLVGDHVTLILKDAIQLERQAKRARFVSNNGNNSSSMNGNGSNGSDDKHTLMTTSNTNTSSNKLGRRVLDVQDINHALIYRGIDPMFTTIHENSSNQRVDLNDFLTSEMQERVPTEISMSMHWLAVDGVQPQIPQNPTHSNIINNNIIHSNTHRKKKKKKKMNDDKDNDNDNNNNATIKDENEEEEEDNLDMEEDKEEEDEMENGAAAGASASAASVRQLLPRLLSEELQLYFTQVTVAMERGTPPQQDAALLSVGRDAGTQELVPFFSRYISSQIYKKIGKPMYCCTLIRLAHALFTNPHLHMELHLHQILPAIITCVVAKRLSSSNHNNHNHNHHADHWSLRKQAALALVQACIIFGNDYTTLKPRVVKTLCEAMGPDKPLTTQYGGIVGISLFGPKAVDAFILPIATIYWNKWESVLQTIEDDNTDDDNHHELKLELQQCQRALLVRTNIYIYIYQIQWNHTLFF